MKPAFSLLEVVISVALISGVILSLFQLKSNNIFYLENSEANKKINSAINLLAMHFYDNKQAKKTYINDVVILDNDDIRREYKDVKIQVKNKELKSQQLRLDNMSIQVKTFERKFITPDGIEKKFYRFKIN